MQVSGLVSRVRAAIDELMANDSGFLSQSSDEGNLDNIIKDKIADALQYVVENAPLEKLGTSLLTTISGEELSNRFSIDSTTLVASLKLPADVLRIVEARLSTWTQYPKPESDTSPVYLMQSDEYAKGSWDRPVNILTYVGTDRYLKMYSAKTTTDTLNFSYITKPTVNTSSGTNPVNVPTLLESALVYEVAGMAMVAFREDVANSLFAIADRYIGIESKEAAA